MPLSNPLVVEAIEDLFVPVLVYNNRKGKDGALLKRFDEPSWNNPIVRYLDAEENDLIPRKDGVWSTRDTVKRMADALRAAKHQVPDYFQALVASETASAMTSATFAMHCYWEGEAKLGSLAGVISTRSAWHGPLEVVTLKYDPKVVEYGKLIDAAQSFECASKVFAHSPKQLKIAKEKVGIKKAVDLEHKNSIRDAKASDQKYYLIQTPLRHLPLSETQATKINSALNFRQPYETWLSPRQKKLLGRVVAATKHDKNALKSFQYPVQASNLAKYTAELTDKLDALESGK